MDAGHEGLSKRIRFEPDGRIVLTYKWDTAIADPEDLFAPEFSIAGPAGGLELRTTPPAEEWRYPIETVAKSERGLDRTRQGESVTLRWPIRLGKAVVEIPPAAIRVSRLRAARGGLAGSAFPLFPPGSRRSPAPDPARASC